jgi:hypothetical protein
MEEGPEVVVCIQKGGGLREMVPLVEQGGAGGVGPRGSHAGGRRLVFCIRLYILIIRQGVKRRTGCPGVLKAIGHRNWIWVHIRIGVIHDTVLGVV